MADRDAMKAAREAFRGAYSSGREAGTLRPGQPPLDPIGRVTPNPEPGGPGPPSFRRGGRVKRTGIYRLHAGERVISARGRRRGRR